MSYTKNLLKSLKLTAKIGFFNYILYKFKPLCRFNIENCEVFVRRGSPDLEVALTSLSGEFKCLENLLPKNFDGLIVDAGASHRHGVNSTPQAIPQSQFCN